MGRGHGRGHAPGLTLVEGRGRGPAVLLRHLGQARQDVVIFRFYQRLTVNLVKLVDKTLQARPGEGKFWLPVQEGVEG